MSNTRLSSALAILRVVVGIVFMAHGGQKLFTYGIPGIESGFAQMGIPLAHLSAILVTLLEFFGGIALVAGLLTRLVALGLAIDMAGATLLVHAKNGFFMPTGYEFTLLLGVIAVTLAIAGAGDYSLDAAISRRHRTA